MESKNYFWELIFILMYTRVSRRFLLIGPFFAEKRVWFSQELPNFHQKYVAYTILSRKTCDGEQKIIFVRRLIFILMPRTSHKAYTILSRHVMENQNYFLLIRDDFCWLDRLLLKNVYDLATNVQIFFKNMLQIFFEKWDVILH